jgi:DNA repair exonuclease SbcCD ATPase subunit
MRPLRFVLFGLAVALVLAGAAPALADIYRWTDDQGREHFTMDLHRVPAEHRGEAQRRQLLEKVKVDPEPEPINTMSTPDSSKVKRALRPHRATTRSTYRSPAAASSGCASWQREKAAKLERKIAQYEKKVELYEQQERRLVRLEDRLRAESAAERHQIYLEQAEEEYESFLSDMRQRGVPPGCLR